MTGFRPESNRGPADNPNLFSPALFSTELCWRMLKWHTRASCPCSRAWPGQLQGQLWCLPLQHLHMASWERVSGTKTGTCHIIRLLTWWKRSTSLSPTVLLQQPWRGSYLQDSLRLWFQLWHSIHSQVTKFGIHNQRKKVRKTFGQELGCSNAPTNLIKVIML